MSYPSHAGGKKKKEKRRKEKVFLILQYWRPSRKYFFSFLMAEKHLAAFSFRENAVLCCWEQQREYFFPTLALPCFLQSILIQLQVG